MKQFVLFAALMLSIACGESNNTGKNQPVVPVPDVENSQPLTPVDGNQDSDSEQSDDKTTPTPTTDEPAFQLTLIDTISIEDASSAREDFKIVSVEITPKKFLRPIAVSPSRMYVQCEENIVMESQISPYSPDGRGVTITPSLVIPPELTCQSEFLIYLEIKGYDYDLGRKFSGIVSELK